MMALDALSHHHLLSHVKASQIFFAFDFDGWSLGVPSSAGPEERDSGNRKQRSEEHFAGLYDLRIAQQEAGKTIKALPTLKRMTAVHA